MHIITNDEIKRGLADSKRVYLCGNLQGSNGVKHLPTDGYEIGISKYDSYNFDIPHTHSFNTEYNYILSGKIKLLMIEKKQELILGEGDLYVIEPDEPYTVKSLPGTVIIFSKNPGGNDKKLYPISEALRRWGCGWDEPYTEE